MNIYIYTNVYIYIYHFFVKYFVFRQCQWDTSCSSRRDLSNALVKSHFRLTDGEIWPFLFRNAPASVISAIEVCSCNQAISVTALTQHVIIHFIYIYIYISKMSGYMGVSIFLLVKGNQHTWTQSVSSSWAQYRGHI